MSYTLEDFKADHDLDQKTIDERKEQLLEEMRLYGVACRVRRFTKGYGSG